MLNLASKLRQDLLRYYFTNPTASLYLRELAGIIVADPANLSRELARLEREGLFISERRGNQKFYRLNKQYALYDEVRRIISKTVGMTGELREALSRIGGIEEAYLYGSFAQGTQDPSSDIDILIVGKPQPETLEDECRKLEKRLGREINYTLLTPQELKDRRKKKDSFIADVWRHKRINLLSA